MEKILFVDACVRPESRTRQLAEYLLEKLGGEVTALRLQEEEMFPLNLERLNTRDAALKDGDLDHSILRYARQFAGADTVVVAAPYWDLSFPALLKTDLEQTCVTGVTVAYAEDGRPYGLCRAKRMFYVTTAGGPILSEEYGFGYLRELCRTFYGIPEVKCIKAEGLDIWGADVEAILEGVRKTMDTMEEKTGK